jgi:hypothetical protein
MNYAEEFIKYMTFEEFANDKKTIFSVTKCIEIVGEATKQIPDSIREISGGSLARHGGNQRSARPWLLQGGPGDRLDDCDF